MSLPLGVNADQSKKGSVGGNFKLLFEGVSASGKKNLLIKTIVNHLRRNMRHTLRDGL